MFMKQGAVQHNPQGLAAAAAVLVAPTPQQQLQLKKGNRPKVPEEFCEQLAAQLANTCHWLQHQPQARSMPFVTKCTLHLRTGKL
jgi:hypothetical protein